MSLRQLPEISAAASGIHFDLPRAVLDRWTPGVRAESDDANSISILDRIGKGFFEDGVTANRIGAALRRIGPNPVRVDINSPGGDFFEGVAIYNQLRAHPAKVTVRVLGLAASAASVIAMAGDEVQMGSGAFLMIHNAWAQAQGNRHDMVKVSELLAPFDRAMAEVYAARANMDIDDAAAMMDAEMWLGASDATSMGFADGTIAIETTNDGTAATAALTVRRIEARLHELGMSRSESQTVIAKLKTSLSDSAGGGPSDSAPSGSASYLGGLAAAYLRAIPNGH